MGGSIHGCTSKSSIEMGFSIINHHSWGTPMTMETPRWVWVKTCQDMSESDWIPMDNPKKWKVWSVWSSEDEKMQSGSIATPYRGPADGLLAGWTKLHRKGTTSWILEVDLGWNRIPAMDMFDDFGKSAKRALFQSESDSSCNQVAIPKLQLDFTVLMA